MKFLCLSYMDDTKSELLSDSERETFMKECTAYDNSLRKSGRFIRLEALESAGTPKPCVTATNKCPSPMDRTLKPKSK